MTRESNKYHLLAVLILLLVSCRANHNPDSTRDPGKLDFKTTDNSEFIAIFSDGTTQIICSDGISYDYHLTPDGRYLAVDYTKFSNLQITKLYIRNPGNKFKEVENLSTIAWERTGRLNNIKMEDMINPRSRVAEIDNGALILQLSGTLEDGSDFKEDVTIELE